MPRASHGPRIQIPKGDDGFATPGDDPSVLDRSPGVDSVPVRHPGRGQGQSVTISHAPLGVESLLPLGSSSLASESASPSANVYGSGQRITSVLARTNGAVVRPRYVSGTCWDWAKESESMNIDQHILQVLASGAGRRRPVTIGDFARRFGVSPLIVLPAARRLVEDGLAAPSTVLVHGVPTLHGLIPLPEPDLRASR